MEAQLISEEDQKPKEVKIKELYAKRKEYMNQQIKSMRQQMQGSTIEECDDDPLAMFSSYSGSQWKV